MTPPTRRREPTLVLEPAPVAAPGRQWLAVAGAGEAVGRRVAIEGDPVVVGSDPACDLCLDDPHVSRRHAELRRTEAGVAVRDLGSRNGTFVERIPVKEALLTPGARLRLGRTELLFETEDEAGRLAQLARDGVAEEAALAAPPRFGDAVGGSRAMRRVFALLDRLAPAELTLTLIGETGTGKDVLARAVHARSPRAAGPFVVFDCGAVAPTLIETELFGHDKGAFTGATGERTGAFERAAGGTLFLDEIGELALDLQPKLLRALEQRLVRRVGGGEDRPVDVRIVAATNRDLEERVREGKFREDLFFRLAAAVVQVPPLRARREDVPALARHFLGEIRPGMDVAPETLEALAGYDWPGNVRELRNAVAAAAAMADGNRLEPRHLVFFRARAVAAPADDLPLAGRSLEAIEKAAIEQTLKQFAGNRNKAAKALGIASSTLYEKLKKYRLAK